MVTSAMKLTELSNEMMDVIGKEVFEDKNMIKNMNANDLRMIQIFMDMIDNSNRLIVKQAETIEILNKKIDMLILKKEEAE